MLRDDLVDQRVLDPERADLEPQAVGQVERADARRIEGAHESEGLLDVLFVVVAGGADLVAGHAQVAVLVDVADQVGRDLADLGRPRPDIEICQVRYSWRPGGPGEDVLERDLLGLLVLARVVGRVEVLLEIGVEVDLVEGVALLLGGSLARRLRGARAGPPPPRLPPLPASWRSAASASAASSCSSSRIGFSTISWVRTSSSSSFDICRSLMACCSDGVITSRCESLRLSFCSRAMSFRVSLGPSGRPRSAGSERVVSNHAFQFS